VVLETSDFISLLANISFATQTHAVKAEVEAELAEKQRKRARLAKQDEEEKRAKFAACPWRNRSAASSSADHPPPAAADEAPPPAAAADAAADGRLSKQEEDLAEDAWPS